MEDHHDDCGEDFGPLGDDYFAEEEAYDGMEPLVSDSDDDEVCCMHLTEVGMNGSDFIPETQQEEAIGAMNFEDLESFLMWNSSQKLGFHDVAELWRSRRHWHVARATRVQGWAELRRGVRH